MGYLAGFDAQELHTTGGTSGTPEMSTPMPETMRPELGCYEGAKPLLSITGAGGFFRHSLESQVLPYGQRAWFVDGSCKLRNIEETSRRFQGGELAEPQLQRAKTLAASPVFAKYDGQRFENNATCNGYTETISTRSGSIRCACGYQLAKAKMPADLVQAIQEIHRLRDETRSGLVALEVDVGIIAIDEQSQAWKQNPFYAAIPDERWQQVDFPLDLGSITALGNQRPIRVENPMVTARLRTLLGEHQAWQASKPVKSGVKMNPNLMYLRNKSGGRVVVAVVELAERGLVPHL